MTGWFTRGGRRFHADGPTQAAALAARGWVPETEDGRALTDLTVPELRAVATENDVPLLGATRKADVVGLLVEHTLHGPVDETTVRQAVADETTGHTPRT